MIPAEQKQPIILSDQELLALIMEAGHDNPVEVSFGGRLLPVTGNAWAFNRVEEMRGIDLEEAGYERVKSVRAA